MKQGLYVVALLAFVVGILTVQIVGWVQCDDRGGDYVRGMFWMECINDE